MTPEEFENKMLSIFETADEDDDPEMGHVEADELMCEVLEQLGYEKGIAMFRNATKWYA